MTPRRFRFRGAAALLCSAGLWAAEQAGAVRLVERSDVLDKVVYALANPVAAHLVERGLVAWCKLARGARWSAGSSRAAEELLPRGRRHA